MSDPLTKAREVLDKVPTDTPDLDLECVTIPLCTQCIDGAGGECHTPGCVLWMQDAPDISIRDRVVTADGKSVVPGLAQALRALVAEHERTLDELDATKRHAAQQERLREFDTGSRELPKGLMLEHARLDGYWREMVAKGDAQRAEIERLQAILDAERARHVIVCLECGVVVGTDEDGCCVGCGRDTVVVTNSHCADVLMQAAAEAGL